MKKLSKPQEGAFTRLNAYLTAMESLNGCLFLLVDDNDVTDENTFNGIYRNATGIWMKVWGKPMLTSTHNNRIRIEPTDIVRIERASLRADEDYREFVKAIY